MIETRRWMFGAICCMVGVTNGGAQVSSPAPAPAAAPQLPVIVAIRDLTPREHRTQAFVLAAPATLQIQAVAAKVGAASPADSAAPWSASTWILDATSRRVVWNLQTASARVEANGVRRFDGSVPLPAGTYELHYASYPATSVSSGGELLDVLGAMIKGKKRSDEPKFEGPFIKDGTYKQFGITVRGAGHAAGLSELAAARRADPSLVASVHPQRHDAVDRTAFTLGKAAAVRVHATGEMSEERNSDFGWIINADSRKDVWRMAWGSSVAAGGAPRNRMVDTVLQLPAGRYVAYFINDGRYDPSDWTAVPPLDPDAWGLSLRIADAATRAAFRPLDWKPVPATGTLATITHVGDDTEKTADFTLTAPAAVQLYALGEASGDEMADYAWLVDMDHHRRVWTMKAGETVWAGGAQKNREYDGVLQLPAGHYQLHYVTDGSHSFEGWNAGAPFEPEYWGVSAWTVTGVPVRESVAPFLAVKALPEIATIRHAGDNLSVEVGFRMRDSAQVRVYAVGEGSSGGMNDYASIEDATTHETVWTMRYSQTVDAGGASKNRQFDGVVTLKAGRYLLRWRSDGSHSWDRWNDDAPDDPEGWGVTVRRLPAQASRHE